MIIGRTHLCVRQSAIRLLVISVVMLLMPAAGWSQACIKTIQPHLWRIRDVNELPDGRFVVNSTSIQSPLIYDAKLSRFDQLPGTPPVDLQSIHRLQGQDLWVAFAANGISRFDPVKGSFDILDGGATVRDQARFSLHGLQPDLWLVSAQFNTVSLGTRLLLLHAGARKITEIADGQFAGFMSGRKGVTALDGGRSIFSTGSYPQHMPGGQDINGVDLLLLDANSERVQRFDKAALPESAKDRLGDITAVARIDDVKWLLGTDRGLYWFDLRTLTLHLLKDDFPVLAISSSQPVWIAASEKGLGSFQPVTQQLSSIESGAMGKVNGVAELRAGRLLIAADRGLFVLPSANSSPVPVQGGASIGRVIKLHSAENERWLIEADEGLYLFNAATDRLKTLAETDRNIGVVQEYRGLGSGIALIRTDRLYRLDAGKEALEVIPLGVSRVSRVLSAASGGYLLETSRGWMVVDANFSNGRSLLSAPSSVPAFSTDLGQGRIVFDPVYESAEQIRQPVTFSDPSSCK